MKQSVICQITEQPCSSAFLGSSRRCEDLHFLVWCTCTLSGLRAFSLEGIQEAFSCCWQLRSNSLVWLSFIAWSPFLFLGRPFDLCFLVNNAVCNVICTIIYGERFDYGDETFKKLLHVFEKSLNEEAGFLTQVNQEHNMFCKKLPSVRSCSRALCFHNFSFCITQYLLPLSLSLWFWHPSFLTTCPFCCASLECHRKPFKGKRHSWTS